MSVSFPSCGPSAVGGSMWSSPSQGNSSRGNESFHAVIRLWSLPLGIKYRFKLISLRPPISLLVPQRQHHIQRRRRRRPWHNRQLPPFPFLVENNSPSLVNRNRRYGRCPMRCKMSTLLFKLNVTDTLSNVTGCVVKSLKEKMRDTSLTQILSVMCE